LSTKLQEMSPTGMFAKAKDDEPLFLLMGRDPSAPDIIEHWASVREAEVRAGRRPAGDMRQAAQARECAQQMRSWRDANDGMWREGMFAPGPAQPVQPADVVVPHVRTRPQ